VTKDTQVCNKQPGSDNLPARSPLTLKKRFAADRCTEMLWIIFIALLAIWLLFVIPTWTFGAFIQVLLLFAVAAFVFQALLYSDTPL
jgi:hypothetical protein